MMTAKSQKSSSTSKNKEKDDTAHAQKSKKFTEIDDIFSKKSTKVTIMTDKADIITAKSTDTSTKSKKKKKSKVPVTGTSTDGQSNVGSEQTEMKNEGVTVVDFSKVEKGKNKEDGGTKRKRISDDDGFADSKGVKSNKDGYPIYDAKDLNIGKGGGASYLVGRSHECDYPKSITHLPILTGQKTTFTTSADVDKQVSESLSQGQSLYNLHIDVIKQLKPDIILTQDICQVCAIDLQTVERVAASMDPAPKIVTLNPNNLGDVLDTITQVGAALNLEQEAKMVHGQLTNRIEKIKKLGDGIALGAGRKNVTFLEWVDPIYFGGHWTPEIIEMAGGYHPLNTVLALPRSTYPSVAHYTKSFRIPAAKLIDSKPEYLIIAPCGLDIETTKKELEIVKEKCEWWDELRKGVKKAVLVDGNHHWNRPGPRLMDAMEWLYGWLHDQEGFGPKDFPFEEVQM
ncbi:hypothetical protein BKA69DRAFT_1120809 [Paraphysoderma sedebokerense]|nr:hypothetical protein BKA69DRAFT_1120809 [Paraphysoderma sedebokerense]